MIDTYSEKWLLVSADTEADVRRFFAVPENWPVKQEGRDIEGRHVWRVLSESWLRENSRRRAGLVRRAA